MNTFNLITFNCFGVPGPFTHQRLLALAAALNASDATFACLQEVQARPYRRLLAQACNSFPHQASEPHLHAPKGGLMTLARLPFGERSFELYTDRGQWYSPALADVALAKGILRTTTTVDGTPVVVLNTHLSANYRGDWASVNRYSATEQRQLEQLAAAVRRQPENALVVVCGDFNVPRESTLYRDFVEHSGLHDPLAGDMRPTYRPLPGIPARYALPIDYTFVRLPAALAGASIRNELHFDQPVAVGRRSAFLSDHIGLLLSIQWDNQHPQPPA